MARSITVRSDIGGGLWRTSVRGWFLRTRHARVRSCSYRARVVSERTINNNVVPVFSFSEVFRADANVFLDITVPAVSV